MISRRGLALVWVLGGVAFAPHAAAQSAPPPKQTPVPKPAPFPGAQAPTTTAKPQTPAATTATSLLDGATIDLRLAGVPLYPGTELLWSFDGGRGQFVFLLGSNMPFADVVAFYRNQLRAGGTEIFQVPAMRQFDLGPFRADTMNHRPSIVVKDYSPPDSPGYLHVSGKAEKRFKTVIQVVPITR